MHQEIFHLRSYGDVTREHLEEYFETGKISSRVNQEVHSFINTVADSPNPQ